ncbi:protein AGENET DOMAIN (AGD)-CONTAINING P1 [Malania oleifera]|uniref:protein AGENET DOMAIN (AGD)-CONTAINING P1 n=1 Tax=Malania oleifera TaxID=397392 RepID=UPI0025AE8B3E|nr:protein AGENET DOMAIN (AGD)-CONTAINING P1 [Malania oleifera]
MEISAGKYVEVCGKEDGFLGSYFVAKVMRRVGKKKLTVEYLTLLSDGEAGQPLREVVDAADVRPLPPQIPVMGFDVLDKVDAFDNDGWWVGRVTGRDFSTYSVYFDSSGDEIAYPISRLRLHQEWENGRWVPSQTKV